MCKYASELAWKEVEDKWTELDGVGDEWCRWDISLAFNPPIGTNFGPQDALQSLQARSVTTSMLFSFRFPETHFPKCSKL